MASQAPRCHCLDCRKLMAVLKILKNKKTTMVDDLHSRSKAFVLRLLLRTDAPPAPRIIPEGQLAAKGPGLPDDTASASVRITRVTSP